MHPPVAEDVWQRVANADEMRLYSLLPDQSPAQRSASFHVIRFSVPWTSKKRRAEGKCTRFFVPVPTRELSHIGAGYHTTVFASVTMVSWSTSLSVSLVSSCTYSSIPTATRSSGRTSATGQRLPLTSCLPQLASRWLLKSGVEPGGHDVEADGGRPGTGRNPRPDPRALHRPVHRGREATREAARRQCAVRGGAPQREGRGGRGRCLGSAVAARPCCCVRGFRGRVPVGRFGQAPELRADLLRLVWAAGHARPVSLGQHFDPDSTTRAGHGVGARRLLVSGFIDVWQDGV